jgi:hypothetical protein
MDVSHDGIQEQIIKTIIHYPFNAGTVSAKRSQDHSQAIF